MNVTPHEAEAGKPFLHRAPRAAEAGKPFLHRAPHDEESGFSLIEAMVALAVLAIATVGLIRTVETHIDSTRGMERRAEAMWVAQNRLAEITLDAPDAAQRKVTLLGREWRVDTARTRTADPAIDKLHIQVFEGDERAPLAMLDGFVAGPAA